MRKFYKATTFLTRELNKEVKMKESSQRFVDESERKIKDMGDKLYKQFRAFVTTNKDLYDEDFVLRLTDPNYVIVEASVVNVKKAYRVAVESNGKLGFIMVPFLFITDEGAYKEARKRKLKFGKNATQEDVEKHYDGKIDKLMAEVEKIKREKAQMYNEDDWK